MRYGEMDSNLNRLVYAAMYQLFRPVGRLALGLEVSGREHIPAEGPALVASNHRTLLDTLALPYAVGGTGRHLTMIARDDFTANPLLLKVFKWGEVIQINRGDFSADNLRVINERLEADRLVGMFPEETRGDKVLRKTDRRSNLSQFKPGVAGFARRHRAPTIPAAISGLDHALTRENPRHARIAFGEPIEPPAPGSESKRIFLVELRQRIENLYAGICV